MQLPSSFPNKETIKTYGILESEIFESFEKLISLYTQTQCILKT